MFLALREMRRAPLKFGLLGGAVSLLVFLILFLSTLSGALVSSFTGALDGMDADGLVYNATARKNLQGSRLDPGVVEQVGRVDGVRQAAGLGNSTVSARITGTDVDLSLFGALPGGPGMPSSVSDGRLPRADGEVAIDGDSVRLGDVVELPRTGTQLTVVGLLRQSRFSAQPTGWVTLETYRGVLSATNPGAPFVPVNLVAVRTDGDAAAVLARIDAAVPGVQALSRTAAVAALPGVSSVTQSFGLLVGITFVIGVVVVGFFFLILTVQKLRVFTLLRGLGATPGTLAAAVATQVVALVLLACAVALVLLYGAIAGVSTGIPVSVEPVTVVAVVLAVLVGSLIAALVSVRRITKIDPARAAGVR